MLPASESKFTPMCCSTHSSQPTLEQVCAVHEISSTCALVRPRHLWQSHKDECGLGSSSWFPSEFLRLKVGFHVEVWNAMYMEILMEYDDGDVVQVDLMEFGWAGSGRRWTRMHELWGSICRSTTAYSHSIPLVMLPARPLLGPAAPSCGYPVMQWLVSCYFLLLLRGKVS